ncbi:MAG: serine hydrolase [Wenzhouxiangellaceae bacterium]|nr:serine hydrolase [Wenzhouxiangellaceae bacterium]MBS3824797.1 serine hydrolase [Wenzhouxiangellaceae bacterium]
MVRLALALLLLPALAMAQPYFPDRHRWNGVDPAEAGFDPEKLEAAIAFARGAAVTEPADLHQVITDSFAPREPNFRILGPTRPRAGDSGIVLKDGRIVAEWGDVHRVDMTFSAVKSYLATVAGLALRDGLIQSIDERAAEYVRDGKFDSAHNAPITWRHLLNQTSDWSGTLWEVPDWADRPEGDDPEQWPNREMHEPGTYFKYNDVRINLLAYGLLQVHRQPLPVVLKREIMDPIGASTTWRWHGYENSWVVLDGQRMQSVSGGGHFGGGMFVSARDHARFGLLMENRGVWDGERLLPDAWFEMIREPTEARRDYGLLWWLNTDREAIPAAPESAYWAAGFGGNYVYVDECNDLVVVLRWVPELADVIEKVMEAMDDASTCEKAA